MDESKKDIEELEGKNPIFKGIIILIITIIITISLYYYNYYLENNISGIQEEIVKIDNSINLLKEDKGIQVYNLIQVNKKNIEQLEKRSKINDFIYHTRSLEQTYGILFKGFNYNNGTITMSAITPFGTSMSAYSKTAYFIKSYREDPKSPFTLSFINSFVGFDTINYGVVLKLK